jgi:hypothetical protein
MLGARLLQLIQAHAGSLTSEVIMDLRDERANTVVSSAQSSPISSRASALSTRISAGGSAMPTNTRFETSTRKWGAAGFETAYPVSEIVYVAAAHEDGTSGATSATTGLVDFAGDRMMPDELLPLELHSIQELNYQVGEFFDRALYHLARGYEVEAATGSRSHTPSRLRRVAPVRGLLRRPGRCGSSLC